MTQLPMEFGMDARAGEAWARLIRVMREAVDVIGFKEVVARLDVQPSLLSEALADRGTRHAQLRWLPTILLLAPPAQQVALLEVLADLCSLEVVRKVPLTPEQRLARLEQTIKTRLGSLGDELVKESLR